MIERKTKNLRGYGGFRIPLRRVQLTNSIFQSLASLEGRNLHGRDGDLLAGVAGIDALACSAVAELEGAETGDGDGRALLEVFDDDVDDGLESVSGGTLGDACSVRNRSDQILLGHRRKGVKEVGTAESTPALGLCKPSRLTFWLAVEEYVWKWLF